MKSITAFAIGFAATFAFLAALTGSFQPDPTDRGFCPSYYCVSEGQP